MLYGKWQLVMLLAIHVLSESGHPGDQHRYVLTVVPDITGSVETGAQGPPKQIHGENHGFFQDFPNRSIGIMRLVPVSLIHG